MVILQVTQYIHNINTLGNALEYIYIYIVMSSDYITDKPVVLT